jgi:hypothetical protein
LSLTKIKVNKGLILILAACVLVTNMLPSPLNLLEVVILLGVTVLMFTSIKTSIELQPLLIYLGTVLMTLTALSAMDGNNFIVIIGNYIVLILGTSIMEFIAKNRVKEFVEFVQGS